MTSSHGKTTDHIPQADLGVQRANEDDEFIWGQFLPILVPLTTSLTILVAGWLMFGFVVGCLYLLGFVILAVAVTVVLAKRHASPPA